VNLPAPQRAERTRSRGPDQSDRPGRVPHKNMVWVPGGAFLMGSNDFYPEERPIHCVTVDGFWMDEHAVTNAEFRRFVKATGHVPGRRDGRGHAVSDCQPTRRVTASSTVENHRS
jgi:formylglycine-generating enzyme required for sulfatase activity